MVRVGFIGLWVELEFVVKMIMVLICVVVVIVVVIQGIKVV